MVKADLCTEVKNKLLNLIEKMDFNATKKLPSEKQLAAKFQVSRSTIRTVLSTLVDEGKLFRRHGSGTFVNTSAFEIKTTLFPQVYFSDMIMRSGYFPEIDLISVSFMKASETGKEIVFKGDTDIVEFKKIYKADGKMCIYCEDYMEKSAIHSNAHEKIKNENISIFQVINLYTDKTVSWDTLKIEATDNLRTKDLISFVEPNVVKPFLKMDNQTFDIQNNIVFQGLCYIDTDLIKFHLFRGVFGDDTLLSKNTP